MLLLGNHRLQLQHLRMKPGRLTSHAAKQSHQPTDTLLPHQPDGLDGLLFNCLQQALDAVAHIPRVQRLLAGKVIVQGAHRDPGLQRHRAGRHALPAIALPNPNIGIENRLHRHLGAPLGRALERLVARLSGAVLAGHGIRTR